MKTNSTTICAFTGFFIFLVTGGVINAGNETGIHEQLRKESMSFLENEYVRIGVDLELGGAITYLSTSFSNGNMINNHDWGRQIQLSFYSGPVPFIPNGKEPDPNWRMLGWNPIQSGDFAGNRSRIVNHSNNGKEIYVKCIPMQWPLDNEPGECFFESWIHLEKNVIKARAKITNHRKDTAYYGSRHQEMPAVYTNIKYGRLVTYRGDKPFTGDIISDIEQDNIPGKEEIKWKHWQATENWAACMDNSGKGLGIWSPETQSFCGGRFGSKTDTMGTKAQATAYLSPLSSEVLDHNIEFEYEYSLIAGTLEEIRDFAYRQKKSNKNALPDYYFRNDRQHISLHGLHDGGWPIKEGLDLRPGGNAYLLTPASGWNAEEAPMVEIEAAYTGCAGVGRIFFLCFGQEAFDSRQSVRFTIIPDGKMRKYQVPLTNNNLYKGFITRLKIEPFPAETQAGAHCKVKRIRLQRKPFQ